MADSYYYIALIYNIMKKKTVYFIAGYIVGWFVTLIVFMLVIWLS